MHQLFAKQFPKVANLWDEKIIAAEKNNNNTIDILDFIGDDFWGGFSARRLSAALRSIGEETDIIVNINSPGGEVTEGITIFNQLIQHKGNVEVRILGMAASIASIIALAGDKVLISKYATFMVHDAWTIFAGNAKNMAEASEYLEKCSQNLAQIYADKTGMSTKEARDLMQAGDAIDGTYLNGEEALAMGFADAYLETEKVGKKEKASVNAIRLAERAIKAANPDLSRNEVNNLINEIKGVSDSAPVVSDSSDNVALAAAKLRLTMALNQS